MKKRAFWSAKAGKPGLLAIRPEAVAVTYAEHKPEQVADVIDGVAVITIEGPLANKGGWWFDDYEAITSRFRSAIMAPGVDAVVLKVDSPGGDTSGCFEAVKTMQNLKARYGKPVYAFADEDCYSAAYALSCVADEVYLPESGGVGSIGVIGTLVDFSEMNKRLGVNVELVTSGSHKADGHPEVPITDEARAAAQAEVDRLAGLFFDLVGEARGMKPAAVKALEANCFYGPASVEAGLADGVMSFADLMQAIQTSIKGDMKNLMALTKAVNDARKALESAEGKKAKNKAAAGLALAEAALAKAVATKAEDEEGERCEDESGDDSDDDEDEDEDSDEDGDDAKKAAKLLKALGKLTGKKSVKEILGTLTAQVEAGKDATRNADRLAKLEADNKATKIESLIAQGKTARKITPGNEAQVRALAGEHGVKALKAYLDAAPAAIETELAPAHELNVGGMNVPEATLKIWRKQGLKGDQIEAAAKRLAQGGASTEPAFAWGSTKNGSN